MSPMRYSIPPSCVQEVYRRLEGCALQCTFMPSDGPCHFGAVAMSSNMAVKDAHIVAHSTEMSYLEFSQLHRPIVEVGEAVSLIDT